MNTFEKLKNILNCITKNIQDPSTILDKINKIFYDLQEEIDSEFLTVKIANLKAIKNSAIQLNIPLDLLEKSIADSKNLNTSLMFTVTSYEQYIFHVTFDKDGFINQARLNSLNIPCEVFPVLHNTLYKLKENNIKADKIIAVCEENEMSKLHEVFPKLKTYKKDNKTFKVYLKNEGNLIECEKKFFKFYLNPTGKAIFVPTHLSKNFQEACIQVEKFRELKKNGVLIIQDS